MTIISEHKGVINFHLTTRKDGNELWKKMQAVRKLDDTDFDTLRRYCQVLDENNSESIRALVLSNNGDITNMRELNQVVQTTHGGSTEGRKLAKFQMDTLIRRGKHKPASLGAEVSKLKYPKSGGTLASPGAVVRVLETDVSQPPTDKSTPTEKPANRTPLRSSRLPTMPRISEKFVR